MAASGIQITTKQGIRDEPAGDSGKRQSITMNNEHFFPVTLELNGINPDALSVHQDIG
jgi:hypothetical protein